MAQQQIIVKPNRHNIVRKAEQLLNARYSLSQLAIKIITTVISMISKDDEDFKLYVLKVQDFKELTETKHKNPYKQLRDACDELLNKKIEFDDGEEVGFMLTRWIASAEYFAGAGEIEIEISQKLRPLLLQLKGNYLNYELGNILALRSNYLIRLYELLKHEYNKVVRYKPNTTAVVHEIKIDWLRKQFKIPSSYRYNDIKRLILDKAVKQFAEHTDILVSYVESKKRAKKVLAVEFTIRANNKPTIYLKDLRTFIAYMRKNYVNQDIWIGQGMILSVSPKGRIYDKKTAKEYDKNKAQKVWEKWYELAKEDKLLILSKNQL
jgi:plasmid replication initiation protein